MATTNHSLRLVAGLVVVAMFALAGCVGVFFAPPKVAQATFPGQNGNIAYEVSDEFDSDIYTINATGGTPFNVTNTNTTSEFEPSYSPDGQKIAYRGEDSGQDSEIYTIDASGGEPVQVTHNTTDDFSPSYSPDGQKIAYHGYDGEDSDIYTIDASGGEPLNVTDNNTTLDQWPSYSPDGQKIAYSGYNGTDGTGQQIYTIDASGGESFRVTHTTTTDIEPSYSPDGQKIAYSGNDGDWEIYTIDASGGEPFNVTNNTRSETDPSWGIADKDAEPTTKEECKNGGYEQFGFKNQGECIRAVEGKKIGAPKATAPGAAGTATTAPDAAVPRDRQERGWFLGGKSSRG